MAGEPLDLLVEETDDHLTARDAGSWSLIKLELLARYYPKFAVACHNRAKDWYAVDAFAGPGFNRIRTTGDLVYGSPLLALRAEPKFGRVLMVDLDKTNVSALEQRTARFGERAVVKLGDANEHLLPLIDKELDRYGPCLVILDPEGSELEWTTVEQIAHFRHGKTKAEQLILFADSMALPREMRKTGEMKEHIAQRIDRFFGSAEWMSIWEKRCRGLLTPAQAKEQYRGLYVNGLKKKLGYASVLGTPVRIHGDHGQPLYTLIFATDHPAGDAIMGRILNLVYKTPYQGTLFTATRSNRLG
ncbi:MAG: three-Cys-motif partner protein TcmP [Actinomycetota bacterium]